MKNDAGAIQVLTISYFTSEDKAIFFKGHCARVFHGPPVVIDDRDLVIFCKGIFQVKEIFIKCQTLLCGLEDIFWIKFIGQGISNINSQWNNLLSVVFIRHMEIWPGN